MSRRRKKYLNEVHSEILKALVEHNRPVFGGDDLLILYYENKDYWNIYARETYRVFIRYLLENRLIKVQTLNHQETGSEKTLYTMANATLYNIALRIKLSGYLSYFSALVIHQITLQRPKVYYISEDLHYTGSSRKVSLSQKAIDNAFSKPQRVTNNVYVDNKTNTKFVLIERKTKGKDIGVIRDPNNQEYPVTDLERTLIDCAVRPQYSGGIFSVMDAFTNAVKIIDIKRLYSYLNELDYIYPYHQLIGFYLKKSGCTNIDGMTLFRNKISDNNFYMTYNMKNIEFDPEWKIYYPKGI